MRSIPPLTLLSVGLLATPTLAADDDKPEWDVANIAGESREIPISVETGTWLSVDVSPDGKTIAFDLLGDIYTMPISGGKATAINS